MSKTLVFIPTYNEVENVKPLYLQLRKLPINFDILFLDDNSPDGTAKRIKEIQKSDTKVHLIVRKKKLGIGSAHKEGIQWAYKKGYKTLITMDSDFTHKPHTILKLLNTRPQDQIVIGSRYLVNDGISQWNLLRKVLAYTGHFMTKNLLKMPYDATGAFRLYRIDQIPSDIFKLIESNGYSFFFESLFILHLNRFKIKEVSIKLSPRTYGSSKMTFKDAWNSFKFLLETSYLSIVYRDSYLYTPTAVKPKKSFEEGEIEWDEYWQSERKKGKILYDSAAVFYRKYIIKRTLNEFIKKNFSKNEMLLHAGCGGGQVDADIVDYAKITALDISTGALNRYKALYKEKCEVLHGSILNIPAKKESFDGIYNLGVMEHFTKKDIKLILNEFHRVLKNKGKIVLFWPPQFGISVIFLNTMHFILNDVLHKKIRLHPEEITKVKSKKQIESILQKSGFQLLSFNFGPKDIFTYVVIVAEKSRN